MNIEYDTSQKSTVGATWASPTLTHFGRIAELTASGSGMFVEQVLCDDTNPPTNCVPIANPTRSLRP